MTKRILLSLACCLAVLLAAELWLRGHLFRHVSYTNSESIDAQLQARDSGGPWKIMFVGDSEVRWGIDPEQVDAGFRDVGAETLSFNHAFDGFGASWWPVLLPRILQAPALQEVETVVIGVQLTDALSVMQATAGQCGSLQRPVLTSPWATDLGLDGMCRTRTWDAQLGRDVFGMLWTVRYAPAVRSLMLPHAIFRGQRLQFNSRQAEPPRRGFQAHRTIAQDRAAFDDEFARWKRQWDPQRDFQPLPPEHWLKLVAQDGFFDRLQEVVGASGKRLALYALPTNPLVIDTFHRRADYTRNSALLAQWAARHKVAYVDLGLQDRADADSYFSDMRHLSGVGARDYSRRLGQALAQARKGLGPLQVRPLPVRAAEHGTATSSAVASPPESPMASQDDAGSRASGPGLPTRG